MKQTLNITILLLNIICEFGTRLVFVGKKKRKSITRKKKKKKKNGKKYLKKKKKKKIYALCLTKIKLKK